MQDQEFYKKINNSLRQAPHQDYDLDDWNRLSTLLDEEANKKYFAWWNWLFGIVLLGAVGSWFLFSENSISSIEKNSSATTPSENSFTLSAKSEVFSNNSSNKNLTLKNNISKNQKSSDFQSLTTSLQKTENQFYSPKSTFFITDDLVEKTVSTAISEKTQLSSKLSPQSNNNLFAKLKVSPRALPQIISFRPKTVKDIHFEIPQIFLDRYVMEHFGTDLPISNSSKIVLESKRRMIGVYGTIPLVKKDFQSIYQNPRLIGVRGKYFLAPRWSFELDIFMVRFKETGNSSSVNLAPTPHHEFIKRVSTTNWVQYQVGASYWFGKNRIWHPYVGISIGGSILSYGKTQTQYRDTITEKVESIISHTSNLGFNGAIPIFINYRTGVLYRFKNPHFNCKLELIYNQVFLKESRSPFLPGMTAGVFYHF